MSFTRLYAYVFLVFHARYKCLLSRTKTHAYDSLLSSHLFSKRLESELEILLFCTKRRELKLEVLLLYKRRRESSLESRLLVVSHISRRFEYGRSGVRIERQQLNGFVENAGIFWWHCKNDRKTWIAGNTIANSLDSLVGQVRTSIYILLRNISNPERRELHIFLLFCFYFFAERHWNLHKWYSSSDNVVQL